MRKLKIDMSELEAAFTVDEMSGFVYYLDLESGKILMTSEDDRRAADEFFEETDADDDTDINEKFEKWLQEYDCPDWQIDSIRDAFLIEREYGTRYIHMPKQEPYDGYNDMVDFTETITDNVLQNMLYVALNGKGAFRRFKDVLYNYPEERQRFFEYSDRRVRERMLQCLKDEDIELES